MSDLAPEPLDAFSALCAAVHALALEAHDEWRNDYVSGRIEALLPHPRKAHDDAT